MLGRRRVEARLNRWSRRAIGRILAIESMLAYASYAEQTGRAVNLDWVEFSAEAREMMLERARCIRDMQQRPGASSSSPKHRLQPALYAEGSSYLSLLPRLQSMVGVRLWPSMRSASTTCSKAPTANAPSA